MGKYKIHTKGLSSAKLSKIKMDVKYMLQRKWGMVFQTQIQGGNILTKVIATRV
jgi:hypothetical protein